MTDCLSSQDKQDTRFAASRTCSVYSLAFQHAFLEKSFCYGQLSTLPQDVAKQTQAEFYQVM